MIRIMIPSLGRPHAMGTWERLPEVVRENTMMVVSREESKAHLSMGRRVLVCPVQGRGMALLRQWMLEYCGRMGIDRVLMMDDDITPNHRTEDMRYLLSTPEQIIDGVDWLDSQLDQYAHAAWSERTYNGRKEYVNEARFASRGIQVVAYRTDRVLATGAAFNKGVPDWFFMEDFHMTLQLLEAGICNVVSHVYRYNCSPPSMIGGCSSYRTRERMEYCAKLLESLHPDSAKAIVKKTKERWGGGERWDVRMSWKKAFKSGQ